MALIPMIYKADMGEESQKGNLPAEALRALFSFLSEKKAGILNITGEDLSVIGNVNVVGSTAQITFRSGYVYVYGGLSYVEEGTQVAFNLPTSGTVNGVIGIKVNLAENEANEVTWFQKTTALQQDDLNLNKAGVYEFAIYNFTATPNTFSLGAKTAEIIEGVGKDIAKYFKVTTAKYTSNGLTLTLQKLPNSNMIFAQIDGYTESLGIDTLNSLLAVAGGKATNYSFKVGADFLPKQNFKVFDSGDKTYSTDVYPQTFEYGINAHGNYYLIHVYSAKEFNTNGVLEFTIRGARASSSSTIVKHPFHYTFIYEGI